MPKRLPALTDIGKQVLRGPRFDVKRIGIRKLMIEEHVPLVRLEDGMTLNEPESLIYWGLKELKLNFSAQVPIGMGNRQLGGGLVDFIVYDTNVAIEYQGPFHFTSEGQAKDFWRIFTRQQEGLTTVFVYEQDLYTAGKPDRPKTIRRLREIVGNPAVAGVATR